jgi:hypothetical protein
MRERDIVKSFMKNGRAHGTQRPQRGVAATKIQTPDLRLQTEKRTAEDTESETQRAQRFLKSW